MTDKELIELAAKAYNDGYFFGFDKDGNGLLDPVVYSPFNPLTNDGDALRLASHLNMDIEINEFFVVVYCPFELDCARVELSFEDEKLKSIKKAITMAAAQIGKEME